MYSNQWRVSLLAIVAILGSLLLFAGVVGIMNFLFRDPDQPFREAQLAALSALLDSPPDEVAFSNGTDAKAVKDPLEVSQFLSLLVDSDPIPAHHTHPEDLLIVTFAKHGQSYLLGRDSGIQNEFWLELYQGSSTSLTLKRIRSEALAAWLLRNEILTANSPH